MRRKESSRIGSCATVMACTCVGPVLEFCREKNAYRRRVNVRSHIVSYRTPSAKRAERR
jgi:hypothetical protein